MQGVLYCTECGNKFLSHSGGGKERKRIGIDLHDDLGQHLNGIALLLEALQLKLKQKSLPETAEVERVKTLLLKTMSHAHQVAHDLASVDLQNDDLEAALKQLATHAESMFQLDCELNTKGKIPALPQTVVKQLYKIAQEAVTNAIKHGKAKKESKIFFMNATSHFFFALAESEEEL